MWRKININISQEDMNAHLEKAGNVKIERTTPESLSPRELQRLA